jgi:hypothetical protein
MTMLLRLGGEWKTISGAKAFAGGSWRPLVAIRVFVGGAWREVVNFTTPAVPPGTSGGGTTGTLTATASPDDQTASGTLASVVSAPITVTPSGGLAPYTYSWTAPGLGISHATRATTTFTKTGMSHGETATQATVCRVTDNLGASTSAIATITFERS